MNLFSDYIKNNILNQNKKSNGAASDNPEASAALVLDWVTADPLVRVRPKDTSTNPKKDQMLVTNTVGKEQTKIAINRALCELEKRDNYNSYIQKPMVRPMIFDNNMHMNVWGSGLINDFIIATNQVWRCMHDAHILPIKNMFKIDLINVTTPLTRYVDYAKKVRDSQIRLPDWFILSNGSKQQKIIPCYDTEMDFMSMALINSHSAVGNTMIMCHVSASMMRNGMHVSDMITRNLFKMFGNVFCLNYIRKYASSPEYCFMIRDHSISYYEHIKYGLLDPNLKHMVLISSRQIYMIVRILKEMRSHLVDELLLINLNRGKIVQEILYDDKYYDMTRVFEKLWPNLEMIVLMKQGGFRVHTERIRKYIGNIKLYCPMYAIPEATIGYDIENDNTYIIDPRKGYFEFIPVKEKKTIVKSIRNLKIDEIYNLVVSTRSSDVQRYVTGEIVRVLGYFNGSPKIDIICKEYDIITIKGLVITPYCIELILMKDFVLVDYCYRYIESNTSNKLKLYIEIDETGYLKDMDGVHDVKQNIKDVDILDHLQDHLGLDAEVRIVMPDTFELLYKNRYTDEIDPAIIQIPRLITDTFDTDILHAKILYMF
jgi:hypothetical protein